MATELIYCADGNKRFAEIAIRHGFLYGSQMPHTVYFPPYFCDQNWKKPNRQKYMAALDRHRPRIATVLDWELEEQFDEVIGWAEEAAQYVDELVVIPKVTGCVYMIPSAIGGKSVRLGYSIPTKFGGTSVPAWEFGDRPVHLLGGSPRKQIEMSYYLNVVSADGNYAQMMACRYAEFWEKGRWHNLLERIEGDGKDAMYGAFEISCKNIMAAWIERQGLSKLV